MDSTDAMMGYYFLLSIVAYIVARIISNGKYSFNLEIIAAVEKSISARAEEKPKNFTPVEDERSQSKPNCKKRGKKSPTSKKIHFAIWGRM